MANRLLTRLPQAAAPSSSLLLTRTLASAPPAAAPTADPIGHCRQRVREHDPDAFLASYFYPAGRAREAFWAYRALNVRSICSLSLSLQPGTTLGRVPNRWLDVSHRPRSLADTPTPPFSHGPQLELATIAEGATNAQLGSIKLRWWKDVVRDISAVRPFSSLLSCGTLRDGACPSSLLLPSSIEPERACGRLVPSRHSLPD